MYNISLSVIHKKVGSIAEKMFKNGWMERIMEQYLKNRR
jgi:hypothetical protein